ncbi:MAG: chalcone isomerase family protein [Gammaproteobacteria bacterium]|nr:chalcone isomerase family protein [Gammaproteobacteria bacterium]MBU1600393.1 chalcone isomerase family protein [Gammaproteobacteria bacterium]MBU2434849.1 chalcone isomerase family protein [Gammaproteobacteria bacterium]MBU2448085.1 chalcone isomerase family protein [Gammaproteobacteria bacterium]MDZ4316630.1 chalcone isomerase family protein [Azonexus sp.]
MVTSQCVRRAALVAALLAVPGLQAAEVAGVRVEEKLRVGSNELVLNGAGLRTRFFIKVYVGALYVDAKASSPAAIIDSNAPRRVSLRLLRDLEAESLHSALDEGLRNNLSAAELSDLKGPAEQLAGIMKGIGKVKEGDTVAIDFSEAGVSVSQNGEARGKVAGAAFARALLKVWLGDKPADAALKKAMLGS